MPRKSDTREKVFAAADQLLQQGSKPTQQTVRDLIGSGSISTINSALNEWWATLSARIARKDQHPELPDPVISAANQLWDQALAYAEHSYQKKRSELQDILDANQEKNHTDLIQLRQTVDELHHQNSRLRNELDESIRVNQQEHASSLEIETQLIRVSSQRDDLVRQVKQLELMLKNRHPVGKSDSSSFNSKDRDHLIEAKVEIKLFKSKINELEKSLESKDNVCTQLREQLGAQEKEALKQQHRLELVIAQQDARYEDALKAFNDCKAELALAKQKF